jgi:hypothetical protein
LPRIFTRPVAPADEAAGFPAPCIFRLCRRPIFELPRISRPSALPAFKPRVAPRLHSPVAPPSVVAGCPAPCTFRLRLGFESPGYPEFSLLRLRLMGLRVASDPAPSGFAVPASSGCPESCIYGWVDDDSRFSSNFASSARLRMNLRVQSGFAHSRLTLVCILSISFGPSTTGKPAMNCQIQPHPASSCQAGTAFPTRADAQ